MLISSPTVLDGLGGTDTFTGIQNVSGSLTASTNIKGSSEDNVLTSYAGNDWLDGDAGNDTLSAGSGTDILIGGTGTDTLTGGAGVDTYVYNNNDGMDTVTDFENGVDLLRLLGTGATFGALTIANVTGGAKVSYSGQDIFTLTGITASQLDSSDFLFT